MNIIAPVWKSAAPARILKAFRPYEIFAQRHFACCCYYACIVTTEKVVKIIIEEKVTY
jgi:hypothetical protein